MNYIFQIKKSTSASGINPWHIPEWVHSVTSAPYLSGGMNSSFPQCKSALNLYWPGLGSEETSSAVVPTFHGLVFSIQGWTLYAG